MNGPILVTGAAGYIGSHACVALLGAGHEVLALDNLCNSNRKAISRVEEIAGRSLSFFEVDMLDKEAVEALFHTHQPSAVMHFAGLKAVGESIDRAANALRRFFFHGVFGVGLWCGGPKTISNIQY